MKLNLEDKLNIIQMVEKGITIKQIALNYNVNRATIDTILRMYRTHGSSYFKEKGKNREYSQEFKYKIVLRILEGESKSSIATKIGANVGLIYSWCKRYDQLGYNGLITKQRGRPMKDKPKSNLEIKEQTKDEIIRELEAKNKRLEMENDLLKKLKALVQQENKK
ncbi:Transposase, putative fragment [Alteracholeplasma palmae J233]|uniref:Transposase, putative n=1 Tax=Alteracholeplasma palmae (strain ATCC 49389 / J233) TaxID=1318466 RepID=U4KPP0_ALTPJ|nr:helix-turn-helix domain-containing protein [Alteracholeplasma palmae]CCV64245.1 Transposase, putative fragment [Alteracholeplasma palmae J233]